MLDNSGYRPTGYIILTALPPARMVTRTRFTVTLYCTYITCDFSFQSKCTQSHVVVADNVTLSPLAGLTSLFPPVSHQCCSFWWHLLVRLLEARAYYSSQCAPHPPFLRHTVSPRFIINESSTYTQVYRCFRARMGLGSAVVQFMYCFAPSGNWVNSGPCNTRCYIAGCCLA